MTCLRPDFAPRQLGFATHGGCKAAVHSTRRLLESLASHHVVVKVDFANVFNNIHRRVMLQAVFDRMPELYAFSVYYSPSLFFYGPYQLQSQEGTQQSDPLGPLLFCYTLMSNFQFHTWILGQLHVRWEADNCSSGR